MLSVAQILALVIFLVMFVLIVYSFWQVSHERKMERRIAAERRRNRIDQGPAGRRRACEKTMNVFFDREAALL